MGDSGTTLITTYGAKAWSLQPSSTTKYLSGIGCNLNLGCYATTQDGYILSTFLYVGAPWNQETQQDLDLAGLSCAGMSGEYRCVAVGDGGTIVSKQIGPSAPDFSLSLQALFTGKFTVRGFNVIVTPLGPFNGMVTLSCSIPGGQSCSLNPTSVVASGTSLMTGPTFLPDWDGVSVTGTSGSLKHTVQFMDNPPQPLLLLANQGPANNSQSGKSRLVAACGGSNEGATFLVLRAVDDWEKGGTLNQRGLTEPTANPISYRQKIHAAFRW